MGQLKIYRKDISEKKEFKFYGDTLKFKEIFPNGIYLYERFNWKGYPNGYELVRPVPKKNPDGNIVQTYPSSEEFGMYGLFFPHTLSREKLIERSWEIVPKQNKKG